MSRNRNQRKRQAGFSLVELLIVITIIGILLAVLIPSAMNYLKSGRETGAIQSLTTLSKTQALFHSQNGKYGTLKDLVDNKLLSDPTYANGQTINGYIYTSTESDGGKYCIQATRENNGSGDRDFNITEDGVVKFVKSASPNPLPYGEGTPLSAGK